MSLRSLNFEMDERSIPQLDVRVKSLQDDSRGAPHGVCCKWPTVSL